MATSSTPMSSMRSFARYGLAVPLLTRPRTRARKTACNTPGTAKRGLGGRRLSCSRSRHQSTAHLLPHPKLPLRVAETASHSHPRAQNPVKFGVNLDVTQYVDGERRTLNPEGRAHANVVWALYEEGCSVRLLNPQTYNDNVWALCATLQEYFGCMVGCNT